MAIELDHFIVPCRDQVGAARQLAELLGVPWAPTSPGPFSPVFVNQGLTLDFQRTDSAYPVHHYCFRVSDGEFDAILARLIAADIPYRANVSGPIDRNINTMLGGRMVYWNVPEGHQWEMLTVSYARAPDNTAQPELPASPGR